MSINQWYCLNCLTSFETDVQTCSNLSCQSARPENGWERILQKGELFDRRFRIQRLLAIGGAGITYLVKEVDDNDQEIEPLLAVKVLFTGRDSGSYLHRLSNEAQIIEQLAHPHIIEYRGFSHISGRAPYLITRFALGGSLMDHLRANGPIRPKAAFAIGAQICSALTEAHKHGVVHRDLKPDNILLQESAPSDGPFHALLADFGIAKIETAIHSKMTSSGTFVGTPNFAAPEQFLAQNITPSIDVYATSALLYYALTGQYVFKFSRRLEHREIIETLQHNLPPTLPDLNASSAQRRVLVKIFDKGLQFDFRKRATLEQIFRLCMEGAEISFRSKSSSEMSFGTPVVEMISARTSGEIADLDVSKQDSPPLTTAPLAGLNLMKRRPKPNDGWEIPEPQYTLTPSDHPTRHSENVVSMPPVNKRDKDISTLDIPKETASQPKESDENETIPFPVAMVDEPKASKPWGLIIFVVVVLLVSLFFGVRLIQSSSEKPEILASEAEVQRIIYKLSALSPGIKQRCGIGAGRISMLIRIDGTGKVTERVSVKSSLELDVDCVYTVISSRTFDRQSTSIIDLEYKASW